jgi:hypothetical protein
VTCDFLTTCRFQLMEIWWNNGYFARIFRVFLVSCDILILWHWLTRLLVAFLVAIHCPTPLPSSLLFWPTHFMPHHHHLPLQHFHYVRLVSPAFFPVSAASIMRLHCPWIPHIWVRFLQCLWVTSFEGEMVK